MVGRDIGSLRLSVSRRPSPAAMSRLLQLQSTIGAMADKRPELLRSPEVARSLKQSLIEAIVGCVDEADGPVPDRAGRSHHAIMQRFKRALEEEPDRALYIPELCAGVGAPERTLRLCCQEHLGLSPKQFLILRRMQLARRALLQPQASTVTEIATRFGFWHFSRFAQTVPAYFRRTAL